MARLLAALGPARAARVLAETLTCEAAGGMLTNDGTRRRTPGGVFCQLARPLLTVRQRRTVFGYTPDPTRRPADQRPAAAPPAAPVGPLLAWTEVPDIVASLATHPIGGHELE